MIEVKPYKHEEGSKRQQVEEMFNSIAHRYDLLNRSLSLGIDQSWRKKAIRSLKEVNPKQILDVATGTADLAIEAMKLNPDQVTGVDISEQMLVVGREKIRKKQLDKRITLIHGDSEHLPFEDNKFDAITVSFGVRNFENLQAGLNEMYRVLKPGGKIAILEFSRPRRFPFRQLYHFYFKYILPTLGGLVSKSKSAYTYLPESVKHFPDGPDFVAYMHKAQFIHNKAQALSLGICTLYTGKK